MKKYSDPEDLDWAPIGTLVQASDGDYAVTSDQGWVGDASDGEGRLYGDVDHWVVRYLPHGHKEPASDGH